MEIRTEKSQKYYYNGMSGGYSTKAAARHQAEWTANGMKEFYREKLVSINIIDTGEYFQVEAEWK